MKLELALGIFKGMTSQREIKKEIIDEFKANILDVDKYTYIIAYVDYGSYEGTGWILMQEKTTGKLFENHSGHCSCYGNEGQFEPEATDLKYLQSDNFSVL